MIICWKADPELAVRSSVAALAAAALRSTAGTVALVVDVLLWRLAALARAVATVAVASTLLTTGAIVLVTLTCALAFVAAGILAVSATGLLFPHWVHFCWSFEEFGLFVS